MKITKATRWKVFAGVWIQSLFTSATAFFSLFALPLTTQFGWSSSEFSMAYTIYMFVYCAVGFLGGFWQKSCSQGLPFILAGIFCSRMVFNRLCILYSPVISVLWDFCRSRSRNHLSSMPSDCSEMVSG